MPATIGQRCESETPIISAAIVKKGQLTKSTIKVISIIVALVATMFFSYWLKCQRGLNLSETISLSKYIPFKYLIYDDVLRAKQSGLIIDEAFNYTFVNNWAPISSKDEKKAVHKHYDLNGRGNAHSLLITSESEKGWNNSYRKYIEVKNGDSFSLECFAALQGENVSASINIALFDANKKTIKWNFFKQHIEAVGTWNKTIGSFKIPQGAKYIKLRLAGKGKGSYRFDHIVLAKTT